MNRRIGIAILLAVLVALAGCSGGQGTATDTETPSPTAPSYPSGYSSSGVADADAALAAHESALLSSPGFAFDYRAVINTSNGRTQVDYTQRAETSSKEVLLHSNITGGGFSGSVIQYYNNDTVYKKTVSARQNRTTYSNQTVEYNLSRFTGKTFVRPILTDVTYGQSERTTYEGTNAVRYSDATLENTTSLLGRNVAPENVTAFSASFVVDARGVVRHIEYSATIKTGSGERTLDVVVDTRTGDISVTRPDWVAKA